MKFGLFDFDRTVTKAHTFKNPEAYRPATNTKAEVSNYLQIGDDSMSAIVTYHDQPEYVLSYIRAMYPDKEFTFLEAFVVEEHCQLTVYSVGGCALPFMIASIPAGEDFELHLTELTGIGKNLHIKAVMDYLKSQHGLKVDQLEEFYFYDDDGSNVDKARDLGFANLKACEIEPSSPTFAASPFSACQLPYRSGPQSEAPVSRQSSYSPGFYQPAVDGNSSDSDLSEDDGWITPGEPPSDLGEDEGWITPGTSPS